MKHVCKALWGLAWASVSLISTCRADVVIDAPTDYETTGIGDYAAVGGSDSVPTGFGQIASLVIWDLNGPNAGDTQILDSGAPHTVREIVTLLNTPNPITSLVLGLGINEEGARGTDDVTMTQLDVTLGVTQYSLQGNQIRVVNYQQQGQSKSEAYIQIDLPFDLHTQNANDAFAITSTITGRSDGREVLFLTSGTAAVPEPSAFALLGLVGSMVLGKRHFAKSSRHNRG